MSRIVAGTLGGRRIAVPRSGTRPTTDRVRESLFNVLDARIDLTDLSVLDLYAGSGALGLEALSRGAASAMFVESDARAVSVIAENVAALGVHGATVRRGAVAAVLAAGTNKPVDLVLADPPYEVTAAEIEGVLAALGNGGWVAAGTVVVVERGVSGPSLTWPQGWQPWPTRRYGDTRLEIAEVLRDQPDSPSQPSNRRS
ncbi:16S rRNA (guanine(966)-N(2))-methyltransferase RsmD [Mycobacterium sp. MMS18-G62]